MRRAILLLLSIGLVVAVLGCAQPATPTPAPTRPADWPEELHSAVLSAGASKVLLLTVTDIIDKNFYSNHSKYGNCLLWWAFDNSLSGNRYGSLILKEGSPRKVSLTIPSLTDINDWNASYFSEGEREFWTTQLKSVFDTIVSTVDNGN